MSKVYCTAPFNALTIREDGQVRTCCVGDTSLGNLNQQSIDDIVNGPVLKEIQQQMLSNKSDLLNCKQCIDDQKHSGVAPLQNHYNQFYTEYKNIALRFLDIRWNNACNLGCMYCSPVFSSVWQDRLEIKRSSVVKNYQDELLTWVLSKSHGLQEIMLVGGEPLLMKQNYQLLNHLSDQCRVSIITNLSYDLPNLPCITKLLSRPKENTLWNISMENTGAQLEYVRNGSSWAQLKDNLKYLNQHWPGLVSVNFVYSMFGAFDILETLQTLHHLGFKKFTLLPVFGQPTMDVFRMPAEIRMAAAAQLQLAQQWHLETLHPEDRDFYPLTGLNSILDQLTASTAQSDITKDEFLNKINWYDQYNTQKFKHLWPNVIDLVDKYL